MFAAGRCPAGRPGYSDKYPAVVQRPVVALGVGVMQLAHGPGSVLAVPIGAEDTGVGTHAGP
jgi:hypothetical protein